MLNITLDPQIPLPLWVGLALGAAALWTAYAWDSRKRLAGRRRTAVLVLMAAALVVPLGILLNPTWLRRVPPPPGRPLLTVLVDRSASMATADAGGLSQFRAHGAAGSHENGTVPFGSAIAASPPPQSRYQAACGMARAIAERLGDRYEVRLRAFAKDSQLVSPEGLAARQPDGDATDFSAAIEASLDEQCPLGQCLLLLSDGIANAGGADKLRQAVARSKALAAPIYTMTLGGRSGARDLEVELKAAQEIAFVHQRVPIAVGVRQRGNLGPSSRLVLRLDGKEIDRRTVKLAANATVEETLFVTQPAPGLYRYDVDVEPLPGEVTTLNNSASFVLRVMDQPVRVLLLEGKPYWDTKFLVRTLSGDESVQLTSVVQLAPGRLLERKLVRRPAAAPPAAKADAATQKSPPLPAPGSPLPAPHPPLPAPRPPLPAPRPPLPAPGSPLPAEEQWTIEKDVGGLLTDPAMLKEQQIVILGRGAEMFLSDAALVRLKKWLTDEEGSLVCFRGPPSSRISQRLGELLPVRWVPGGESRLRVDLTPDGRAAHWLGSGAEGDLLAAMPPLAAADRPEPRPYLASVLATGMAGGQAVPMVTWQPVGSGRVVAIEGAGMWRWALMPPQYQDRDEVYGNLWRSLVRWLVSHVGLLPSERLALRTDKVMFHTDEEITATLLLREAPSGGGVPRLEIEQLIGPGTVLLAPPKRDSPIFATPLRVVPAKIGTVPQSIPCRPWGTGPGQYRADLGRLPEGRYRLRVAGAAKDEVAATALLDVRGNWQERLDLAAQPETMQWIANESGGAELVQADPESLAEQFNQHLSRTHPARIARATAWDRWWALAAALGLWAVTWGLRRNTGLV
jgi:hypothetical protein